MKWLLVALTIIFTLQTACAIEITEIMYNPSESESYNEWIEIYINDTVNLENFTLCDVRILPGYVNDSDQKIYKNDTYILPNNSYALITDGGTGTQVYYNFNVSGYAFHVNSSQLCDGLSNTNNKMLFIKNNNDVIENLTYAPSAPEGKTLCSPDWHECEPTPGYMNIFVIINETINETDNETNTTINSTIDYCDPSIIIETDKGVFENESIEYDLIISDFYDSVHEIKINYWEEDLFGNVVRAVTNTTKNVTNHLTIGRTWTPDDIIGSEAYVIKANISDTGCNDTNTSNNFYEKNIIFKGSEPEECSYIQIIDSTDTAKYGESVDVKVKIYRNNTAKYAIYTYVTDGSEKISQETTFHAKTKNTLYETTLPIQLKPNCDSGYTNGVKTIVVEGLGLTSTKTINVDGISSSLCKTSNSGGSSSGGSSSSSVALKTSTAPKTNEYEVVSYPLKVHVSEEFEVIIKINTTYQRNVSVYSYVNSGKDLLSEGYSKKWLATWSANKQSLITKSATLTLKNKIRDDTKPGMYNLRVRFVDTKEHDIDNAIIVLEKENVTINNTLNVTKSSVKNATNVTTLKRSALRTTGMAAAGQLSPQKKLITFLLIKHLIKLIS
jgi:hypothetical protein